MGIAKGPGRVQQLSADDKANLLYLGLLAIVVIGSLFIGSRRSAARLVSQALLWALIFLGVVAARGLWDGVSQTVLPRQAVFDGGQRVEVPRARDGHYHVTLKLNGADVDFVVDTGATDMVLSHEDARRAGLDPDKLVYLGHAMTANGQVATAPVRIDRVELGGITDRRVGATVTESGLDGSLLGMSYLQRFDSVEMRRDMLILTR